MNTVSAMAKCAFCPWSAKMTGETVEEIATFLGARLKQHVEQECPKRPQPEPRPS